jgi:hypothetical protein
MPLPGALLDSDDDDVPSHVAAPVTPQAAAPTAGRAGLAFNDECTPSHPIGQSRPLSSIQSTNNPAAAEESSRNVRPRTEVSASTPVALSRTPSTGWGIGLVAVTPRASAATPTAADPPPAVAKVENTLSPQNSPRVFERPRGVVEALGRTGSSEGSDSDAGEGLSKGILADSIESVQREIDLLNSEIQVLPGYIFAFLSAICIQSL